MDSVPQTYVSRTKEIGISFEILASHMGKGGRGGMAVAVGVMNVKAKRAGQFLTISCEYLTHI